MFDPTPQGAVLADACRRDLYGFTRVLSEPDVHRSAGGAKAQQPANFMRLYTTQALIRELDKSSDVRSFK